MEPIGWTSIILAVISLISGCGWILDRKKHRQEVEALKADNRQKDMNLSKDYVTEWRTYIAEPLQREVGELRQEVAALRNAIQKIDACTMRLKGLTAALIGLSVLCWTGCGSSRTATSSHSEQLSVLSQESEQVRAESSELARDTLIEVTTVTVQLNEVGDTVKTSTVTDRTRARAFDRRKDVEIRTEIVRDTVYVEKRDSSLQVTAYGLQEDPSARSG